MNRPLTCGDLMPEDMDPTVTAREFLQREVEKERMFEPHGLNKLPLVLYPRVAKLMDDFAEFKSKEESNGQEKGS